MDDQINENLADARANLSTPSPEMQTFATVRRQAVRNAILAAHGRDATPLSEHQTAVAVGSLRIALAKLRAHIERLRPLLENHLDDAIAAAASDDGRIKAIIANHGLGLGFSSPQIDWVWSELQQLSGTASADLLPNGVDDLLTIIDGTAADDQILAAGFIRSSSDVAFNARVQDIAGRFRSHGVTASAYHVLCLALIAAVIAATDANDPESAKLLSPPAPDVALDENALADERLVAGPAKEPAEG